MGVNGIYGLSGSGLDVESMVKVGMLSKQSEYEKMQQKYTVDEWKKTEMLSLYGEIQTFNASTLSKYKMSSNMNSRSAESADTSSVKATANANAATMTHYVEVGHLASSAYLIGTNSPTRLNTAADQKTQLSSVLFSSIETVDEGGTTKYIVNEDSNTKYNADDVAFSFSINDGVNGLMTSDNSDVVVATASPDVAKGEYTVKVTALATSPPDLSANISGVTPSSSFKNMFNNFASSNSIDASYMTDSSISNTTAIKFTVGDGTNSSEIEYKYSELQSFINDENFTMKDFINSINEKIGDNVNVTASISDSGALAFSNNNIGADNKIIVTTVTSMHAQGVYQRSSNPVADNSSYDSVLSSLLHSLVGSVSATHTHTYSDGTTVLELTGTNATATVTDENNVELTDTTITGNTITAGGMTITAKAATTGMTITNDKSQVVSVTYRELLDGFTFYDLTSKVNSMGLNVRLNYDSVQDRFSLYNKKSGKENQINIQLGTGNAATNAETFFNKLGLQQSSNGEIVGDTLKFDVNNRTISQVGVNAVAKVDGIEYKNLDSNNLTVDGVTYNFQNITTEGKKVPVTVTQDTESIVKNVQSFVDDYNALLTKLYKWYDEKPNSDYKPLTETQKSGMKEEQIEKWEAKAKAGMLYHDKTLGNIITELRSAVSENVEGVNGKYKNIFAIGISTTGLKGQLTLDKDKLKAAIAEDPDAVYNVFAKLDGGEKQYLLRNTTTGKTFWSSELNQANCEIVTENGKEVTKTVERASYNGIAQRLGDVFMAGMKSVKAVSGSTADVTEDSELNNLMRELQTKMSNFKRMMQAFETRLYKKYDAMESSLALLGSQLNYVTSAFQ